MAMNSARLRGVDGMALVLVRQSGFMRLASRYRMGYSLLRVKALATPVSAWRKSNSLCLLLRLRSL
jgi:hypothetical protein